MNITSLAFSPHGKIKRLPFLWMQIAYWIISLIIGQVSGIGAYYTMEDVNAAPLSDILLSVNGVIAFIVGILILYSAICVTIKRFRDMGQTPWLTLLMLIPLVNLIVFLFLLFTPSKA